MASSPCLCASVVPFSAHRRESACISGFALVWLLFALLASTLLGGGIEICRAPTDQLEPAVVFDGANFLVSWTDPRDQSSADIYAARVTPQGRVLDPSSLLIAGGNEEQMLSRMARGAGDCILLWQEGC